jgi:hypothetical protein
MAKLRPWTKDDISTTYAQGNCTWRDGGDEAARHTDEGARSADLITGKGLSGRMLLGACFPVRQNRRASRSGSRILEGGGEQVIIRSKRKTRCTDCSRLPGTLPTRLPLHNCDTERPKSHVVFHCVGGSDSSRGGGGSDT